jgi:hypothetical protein
VLHRPECHGWVDGAEAAMAKSSFIERRAGLAEATVGAVLEAPLDRTCAEVCAERDALQERVDHVEGRLEFWRAWCLIWLTCFLAAFAWLVLLLQ